MRTSPMPKFSLVMGTVGRVAEVERFLQALCCQSYQSFELIVVDQNPDDRLTPVLDAYQGYFPIIHLRSERGLSRARNVGLKHISGDIVAFPDDDCWYPENLLDSVACFFQQNPNVDGLAGRSIDERGRPAGGRWDKSPGPINRYNIWRRGISYTIFLKKYVVDRVGFFDEDLGVGADTPWGSGEETDFLLRALQSGFHIFYCPDIVVYHPQPVISKKRAFSYGLGTGRVLRKHNYPIWWLAMLIGRSLGGLALAASLGKWGEVGVRWASLKGRVVGWIRDVDGSN